MLVQLQTSPIEPIVFGPGGLKASTKGYYFYITEACNLRCDYCFVDDKKNNVHMDDSMLLDVVDFIVNDPDGRTEKYIHFFGGEPLIRLKSIDLFCTELFARIFRVVPKCIIKLGLTTNGTLLTEDTCQLLKKWNIGVQLSLDGSEEGNDVHRKVMGKSGAFHLVKHQNYLKYFGNNCRMTVTPSNVGFLAKSIRELTALGFRSFSVIPEVSSSDWDGNWEELRRQVELLFEFAQQDASVSINIVDMAYANLLNRDKKPATLCQAGRSLIGISVNGDIWPCHDFLGKFSKTGDANKLIIGHIKKGYTKNIEQFSDVAVDNTIRSGAGHDCSTCHASSICDRGCPYINFASAGDAKIVNSVYCKATRLLGDVALRYMFLQGTIGRVTVSVLSQTPPPLMPTLTRQYIRSA
jgi:uncharacterized protein